MPNPVLPSRRTTLASLMFLLGQPSMARAQVRFPAKPVRLLIPFPKGGGADVVAGIIAEPWARRLGQAISMENHGGDGGLSGLTKTAEAVADGYSIALSQSIQVSGLELFFQKYKDFNLAKKLTHILPIGTMQSVVVTSAKSGIASLTDFASLNRTMPAPDASRRIQRIGAMGPASADKVLAVLLSQATELWAPVADHRTSSAVKDSLMNGDVTLGVGPLVLLLASIKAGDLKCLAVASRMRSPSLPNVPTTAELGFPGVVVDNYYGIVGPGGLDAVVTEVLASTLREVLLDSEIAMRLRTGGLMPLPLNSEAFAQLVEKQSADWASLLTQHPAAIERARRVAENWSKLRAGLTAEEVDLLIGPLTLNEQQRQFMRAATAVSFVLATQGVGGGTGFENEAYKVDFDSQGGLRAWFRK